MSKPTVSVNDVFARMKGFVDSGLGDEPVYICVPFRNGIGYHYEGIRNMTRHSGIIDFFVTTPDSDDIEKPT